jgi:rod shape-determining protein MreC
VSIELAPRGREGRSLIVLIPLLILHLVLISVQVQDPAGTLLIRRWVLGVTSPFFNVSSAVSYGVKSVWNNYVWLHGAREENRKLHDTVQKLALRDSALSQVREENDRLRSLLGFTESTGYEGIGARVVGRAPAFLTNLFIINRGSADGVRIDAPVVSGNGILGRTVVVSPSNSQVQLITNPDASVGVMLARLRSPGVLKGTGKPLLELHYLSNSEPVEVGDVVVTSGLDGIFPKGLPVGAVVDSHKGKSVFRVIQVRPYADVLRIEEVLVLRDAPRPGVPSETSAENK